LLDSQFTVLEEPRADEHAIVVSVAMSPRRVVEAILAALQLQGAAEEGT
jgi:gluconate kinase